MLIQFCFATPISLAIGVKIIQVFKSKQSGKRIFLSREAANSYVRQFPDAQQPLTVGKKTAYARRL
jgi:hypothetical protein